MPAHAETHAATAALLSASAALAVALIPAATTDLIAAAAAEDQLAAAAASMALLYPPPRAAVLRDRIAQRDLLAAIVGKLVRTFVAVTGASDRATMPPPDLPARFAFAHLLTIAPGAPSARVPAASCV